MSTDPRTPREAASGAAAICAQPNKPVRPLAETMCSPDPSNLSRSESYNMEVTNWQRARSVIEHENTLINHRVTWLLVSQAALLAAFGTLYTKLSNGELGKSTLFLLCFIALIGSVICLNVFYHVRNAQAQLNRITEWWYREAYDAREHGADFKQKYHDINRIHPPLHFWPGLEAMMNGGRAPLIERLLIRTQELPLWFVALWALVVAVIVVS